MDKHGWAMDQSIQRRFEAAVKVMRSLPGDGAYELSDDMLVMFYSYYKQATAGPCNTLNPNSWDPIGEAKWKAWKALGNMSKDEAMIEYVQEIQLIIETLPVTDRMAELMDALDPFYEIVEDDDKDVSSKPTQLSTGITDGEYKDVVADEHKEDESDDSDENIAGTLTAHGEGLPVLNIREENSVSSSTNDIHSSLNTEEQEEELVYSRESSTEPPEICSSDNDTSDESDDKMYSNSMDQPAKPEKGSRVPRVHLADLSVAGANSQEQQGGNRDRQCGSQDGKPQGVTPPVPHPPALGTVQIGRMSQSRGRGCQFVRTNSPGEHDLTKHSCQGDVECREMEGSKDKQAFHTQIALTLSQLQDNMQDVLQRLNTLEVLTASQAEIISLESCRTKSSNKRLPWWPLDSSRTFVVLAVMWPFAAHWLVQFYSQKRRWPKVSLVK